MTKRRPSRLPKIQYNGNGGKRHFLFVGRDSYLRSTPEWFALEKAGIMSPLVGKSSGVDRGRGKPPKMRKMGWLWDRGQGSNPGLVLL
ncbi:hypothetical protein AG4045_011682 [Apium graveolens]|uniref:Uncharacterized protein n=1 Tax=Apium graveolens TaxID=4045 RepID=A0A6L5BFB8_APIGR|nr:hypothetical protein AG4045_011682 [Apium graveolens]